MIRRTWTPQDAQHWTKEDWIAIVLSPLAYFFIALGVALSLFLKISGFIFLLLGILCAALMYYVINPKLQAVSNEYEERQKKYLEDLETKVRWGDDG